MWPLFLINTTAMAMAAWWLQQPKCLSLDPPMGLMRGVDFDLNRADWFCPRLVPRLVAGVVQVVFRSCRRRLDGQEVAAGGGPQIRA